MNKVLIVLVFVFTFTGMAQQKDFETLVPFDSQELNALSCLAPSLATFGSVTDNSGVLTISSANGTPIGVFQVSYGLGINTPQAGVKKTVSGTIDTLDNLQAFSKYCFFLREICAVGDTSNWSPKYCFRTKCGEYSSPFNESFDSTAMPGLPDCWSYLASSSHAFPDPVSVVDSVDWATSVIPSLPGALEINESQNAYPTIAITPAFAGLNSGYYRLRFKAAYEAYGSGQDTLYVGTMSDPTDPSTFVKYEFIAPQGYPSFAEYNIPLNDTSLIGNNQYVGFMSDLTPGANFEYYIDDFYFEPNECDTIKNVLVKQVNCDTALISWSTESPFAIIEYGPQGFTLGQGTIVGPVSSPYAIDGLLADTMNDVYVRSICMSDTGVSQGPVAVKARYGKYLNPIKILSSGYGSNYAMYNLEAPYVPGAQYYWHTSNGQFHGGRNVNIGFTSDGLYTVSLSIFSNCGLDSSSIEINVAGIGVEENSVLNYFELYPNPANDRVLIKFNELPTKKGVLKMYDVSGRIVWSKEMGKNEKELEVDLSALAKGVYSVHLSEERGRLVRKLVKE